MIIREMQKDDLPQVLAIENESFIATWGEEQFNYELNDNPYSYLFVAVHNDQIIGFIDFWITFDTACINQIAVAKAYRHKGVGEVLMIDAFKRLELAKVQSITLEVRTHNEGAIHLYNKLGFKNILTKEHYYDNGDDAYYMVKECDIHE